MGRKIPKTETVVSAGGYYGTKEEWVVKRLDNPIVIEAPLTGYVHNLTVVAKDEKGYYLTKEEYVRGKILDPFRMYSRPMVPEGIIKEIEKKNEETTELDKNESKTAEGTDVKEVPEPPKEFDGRLAGFMPEQK